MNTNWKTIAWGVVMLITSMATGGCSREGEQQKGNDPKASNVLLTEWKTDFAMPPFGSIPSDAYVEAFDTAATMQNKAIAAIIENKDKPTFDNTIVPYERSRSTLYRVLRTFLPVSQAAQDAVINKASEYIYPAFAAHEEAIFLNAEIFRKVDAVYAERLNGDLEDDQVRLVELIHQEFVKSGVGVSAAMKPRLEAVASEMATLKKLFTDNISNESNAYELLITKVEDLGRLPETILASAKDRAAEKGHTCECWSFGLKTAVVDAFLQYSPNRALRETLYKAYMSLGENDNEWNNRAIVNRVLELRAERAGIMGFNSYADYETSFSMAETPENAERLLTAVYKAAVKAATADKELVQQAMKADGIEGEIRAWDWAYYAEMVRIQEYAVSDEVLRPYFSLQAVRAGAFEMATKLFGLQFKQRDDLPRWHPDQVVFEVVDHSGVHVGVLMQDYFSRENKATGAWTDEIRVGETMDGDVSPIAANNYRYAPQSGTKPTLLSLQEGRDFFHEFGHALHTLLAKQRYVRLSGFNYLPRDGTEYPSMMIEYWFETPSYLRTFAKHHESKKPIPDELIERIDRSSRFNVGHDLVKTAASALLDLRMHALTAGEEVDVAMIEKSVADELGLPEWIGWRYKSGQFRHSISVGYAAAYYGYLWADVLAADAFGAFEETSLFDADTSKRLRESVFEIGAAKPQLEMFIQFRGREPDPAALLGKSGLN